MFEQRIMKDLTPLSPEQTAQELAEKCANLFTWPSGRSYNKDNAVAAVKLLFQEYNLTDLIRKAQERDKAVIECNEHWAAKLIEIGVEFDVTQCAWKKVDFKQERDQLKQQLEASKKKECKHFPIDQLSPQNEQGYIDEIAKLKQQNAELMTNKEMLDWLDNAWQGLQIDYEPRQYQSFLLIHVMTKQILGMGPTLRQAFTAVMNKTRD